MAFKKISLQEEHILQLILQFLSSRKYYKSARALEKESGASTNPYSENISFFRDLVLDGDWAAVREFGEPLADVPAFEYRRFNFLVAKQEYLEILFEKCEVGTIKDEQKLRDRLLCCLQNLELYCTFKEEYNKLYWYLSVPSLRTEPEFCDWSVDSSRMQLFEEMLQLLKQFIPIGEQNLAKNSLASEDRLLALLFKGSLYENCIEFCQKQAMAKMGISDFLLSDIKVELFRKQSLKSAGNFYSWLHSLSKESFVVPFEELNFDIQVAKLKSTKVSAEVKNNSLSRSLTIELKTPSKAFLQKGKDERRKRFTDFPACKPTFLEFDMRDVSQSFAEFEFAESGNNRSGLTGLLKTQKSTLKDQEVFLQNGEIYPNASADHVFVSPSKAAESPRKTRRDQQDLVLQQLEEHKQRQRELYEQLAESASLAKVGGRVIKDTKTNDVIPDESVRSLEAVKKSIQSLKLLAESYESPKRTQIGRTDQVKQNTSQSVPFQQGSHPNTVTNETSARKSSSSTPGSATLPKTPVNTCLPPGLVKLTDGSGVFNTSTPKAERQSFTTPLPASPVASEQRFPRNDILVQQSLIKENSTQNGDTKPDAGGQTPKASAARQLTVRRSLVNTGFQNEDNAKLDIDPKVTAALTNNTNVDSTGMHNASTDSQIRTVQTRSDFVKETLGSDPLEARNQTSGSFPRGSDVKDSRFQASSGLNRIGRKVDSHATTSLETKNSKFQKYSAENNYHTTAGSRLSRPNDHKDSGYQNINNIKDIEKRNEVLTAAASNPIHNYSTTDNRTVETRNAPGMSDLKDSRIQDISATKNTRSSVIPTALRKNEGALQSSNDALLNFKKSAMLADTQAIRAVAFHPNGNYFAVGTNSKALKICRTHESSHFERDERDTPELEVLYQKTSIHKGSVYCVAFSSNGEVIATGSNDKTIKLSRFDADSPVNLEVQMELSIHNATVRDLTFVNSAAGGLPVLASGGAGGGLIHLSDCHTGQTLSSLQGHAGNVMAVFASDQAHLMCSGSADKTVRLWDLRMAKCIDVIATSSCVTSVCFNYGTTHSLLVASADDNGQCIVYDVGARKSITSFTPHEMDCRSIRFSPDSRHLLTGSYDACVAVTSVHYNSSDLLSESRVVARHRDKVIQCRWHPSECMFLSSSADKTVVLWQENYDRL